MISLSAWRIAIGAFNSLRVFIQHNVKPTVEYARFRSGPHWRLLLGNLFVCLLLLLMIGGIEHNPGPVQTRQMKV